MMVVVGCPWYFDVVEKHLGRVHDRNNRRNTLLQSLGQSRFDRNRPQPIPRNSWYPPLVSLLINDDCINTCTNPWQWCLSMFGARFARFVLRSSVISTRFSIVCFWPLALRVKTDEFWMENIVKIGLVIQNNVTKYLQTCSKHGPVPISDDRTCCPRFF